MITRGSACRRGSCRAGADPAGLRWLPGRAWRAPAGPDRQRQGVTGKYAKPPVDVVFDRLCRENGVDHLLTQPASPTTTGKIERFHRTLRIEFDTRRAFASLAVAQQELDEWVTYYNTQRPHQALGDNPPVSRFHAAVRKVDETGSRPERSGEPWVTRMVSTVGVVCRLPAGLHRPELCRQRLQCPGHGRDAAVLGGRRAGEDGGPGNQGRDSQEAR